MSRITQEELPLWPLPRWPSAAYLADAFTLYLVASVCVGLLVFGGIVVVARPLWAMIFVAGVMAGWWWVMKWL
jgi:Flp pilus assembly protein TadB